MTIERFEESCIRGVKSAFKKHYKFTGGLPLGRAPEGFIQGEIACALARVSRFVTLETGVKELLLKSNAEMRGKKPRNGRIDIAAWWKSGKPRFLIEIKKVWPHDSISSDVKRLRQVLGRGDGTCREGLVVAYVQAKKAETLERRLTGVAGRCKVKRHLTHGPVPYFNIHSRETEYWGAACFRVDA